MATVQSSWLAGSTVPQLFESAPELRNTGPFRSVSGAAAGFALQIWKVGCEKWKALESSENTPERGRSNSQRTNGYAFALS